MTVNGQEPKIWFGQQSNCEKLTVKILTKVAVVTTGHITGHMGVTPPPPPPWLQLVQFSSWNTTYWMFQCVQVTKYHLLLSNSPQKSASPILPRLAKQMTPSVYTSQCKSQSQSLNHNLLRLDVQWLLSDNLLIFR